VQKAEANGTKLNMMIEEMLDAYRLEVGLLNMNRQSCDLSKILEACYLDNLQTARTQNVSLVLAKNEGPLDLTVDSKQLSRAFNNLIGNAIKYTDAGGEVSISMETVADTLHISVDDTGIGIPPEDLPRIFYKYYRSDGASRFKGTGLGLAISKDIIEAHGGSLGVESTLGEGSRFKIMIPLTAMGRIKSGSVAQGEQDNG
jgi:signal transduction histidine kinase